MDGLAGEEAKTAAAAYLDELAHQRRASPLTLESYGHDLAALLALAGATSLDKLKHHDIRRFVAQLHGRGLSGRTLARVLSAWRGYRARQQATAKPKNAVPASAA